MPWSAPRASFLVQEPYGRERIALSGVSKRVTMNFLFHVDVLSGLTTVFRAGERAMGCTGRPAPSADLQGRNEPSLRTMFRRCRSIASTLFSAWGNGLVGQPEPHLLQRGALDLAELGDVLLMARQS